MVRGNFQKRLERTERRRTEAKARKESRDAKSKNKALAAEFLGRVEKQKDRLVRAARLADDPRAGAIHVWVDTRPEGGGFERYDPNPVGAAAADTSAKKKGRGKGKRSCSDDLSSPSSARKPGKGKKKAHPRSKEGLEADTSGSKEVKVSDELTLCAAQFFHGKSPDSSKKTSNKGKKGDSGKAYRHVLLQRCHPTLASVVGESDDLERAASAAKAAFAESFGTEEDIPEEKKGGIDMVYPLFTSFLKPENDAKDDIFDISIKETIISCLSARGCPVGSIVYVALGSTLVFDRYRDGMLLSQEDLVSVLLGEEGAIRKSSVASEGGAIIKGEDANLGTFDVASLPGQLLEKLLTFLPDAATAIAPQVCTAWKTEIGTTSPELWRYLLHRRNWPMPVLDRHDQSMSEAADQHSPSAVHRDAFVSHYVAHRDLSAIQAAFVAITDMSTAVINASEAAFHSINVKRGEFESDERAAAVFVLSEGRAIAAYINDCSVRLFQAVGKVSVADENDPKGFCACKESICMRVAPASNTKTRRYNLVAMDIDDQMMGFLCKTYESNTYFITTLAMDDFLTSSGGGSNQLVLPEDGVLHSVDVKQAVLAYILSIDNPEETFQDLMEFLEYQEDNSSIDVTPDWNIIACSNGHFLIVVTISIPGMEENDNGEGNEIQMAVATKFVLVSVLTQTVLWMRDLEHDGEEIYSELFAKIERRSLGDRRRASSTDIVLASGAPEVLLNFSVSQKAGITNRRLFCETASSWGGLTQGGWNHGLRSKRRILEVTPYAIIIGYNLERMDEDGNAHRRAALAFFPRNRADTEQARVDTAPSFVILEGQCELDHLKCIGDNHVAAVSKLHDSPRESGHFMDEDPEDTTAVIDLVHVSSRQVLAREPLCKCMPHEEDTMFPSYPSLHIAYSGGTVAAGVSSKGMILTGKDVRSIGDQALAAFKQEERENAEKSAKKVKKKKRLGGMAKGRKKDGFARGQSVRG